jgi:hypothetical protein
MRIFAQDECVTQDHFPSISIGPVKNQLSQPDNILNCSGYTLPSSTGIDRTISALTTSSNITPSDKSIPTIQPSGPRRLIKSGRNSTINPFFIANVLEELPVDDALISQEDWNHLYNNLPPSVSSHERLFIFCASIYGTRGGILKAKVNGWKYRRTLRTAQRLYSTKKSAQSNRKN